MEFFEEAFEGYEVPSNIRKASEEICTRFNIKGICDPMYISNVIALESGSGTGGGEFYSGEIDNIEKLAKRLQGAYGCNIRKDEIEKVIEILSR